MAAIVMRGDIKMDKKIVSISSKRQITIPKKYFQQLGFEGEAEFVARGNELVIRPVRRNAGGDFAEVILAELVAKGLSGEALLSEFKKAQAKIRPAVEAMISDAEEVATGKGSYQSYDDVFGAEEYK